MSNGTKNIASNKKAFFEYFVLEKFEAGIELVGTEVKSIRAGGVSLKESWCMVKGGEIFVNAMHIAPYTQGNIFNRDPFRVRRLLMHKKEIERLYGKIKQDGLTVIPLSVYFKGSKVKLGIGLCKGKNIRDKRQTVSDRDTKREIQKALKERNR